jgi:hypothetical protein
MKKPLLKGMHGHGFCCEKGKKGKFMCCSVFKQGFHTWNTCPLLVVLFRSENIAKKQHADIQAYLMDEDTIAMLNAPNNVLIGEFIHQHPMRPIVSKQIQYDQDAYYCENNIITTNIVGYANNSSPIRSTTSGEAAEEYLSEYMVKEKANLKEAIPSLLAALDQIIAHPSKAEDTGSNI